MEGSKKESHFLGPAQCFFRSHLGKFALRSCSGSSGSNQLHDFTDPVSLLLVCQLFVHKEQLVAQED